MAAAAHADSQELRGGPSYSRTLDFDPTPVERRAPTTVTVSVEVWVEVLAHAAATATLPVSSLPTNVELEKKLTDADHRYESVRAHLYAIAPELPMGGARPGQCVLHRPGIRRQLSLGIPV
jgi:hypothetical protein